MQHEQDAVEGGLIAHCELACATFGGGSEGGDQGLQLQPQFFANGLSCHEGMKHNCFMRVSWAVVLATLKNKRPLLHGRVVLQAVMATWQACAKELPC